MRLLMLGALLLVAAACRNSTPPPIQICRLNGFGGARCALVDGTKVDKLPSELDTYFATTQQDMSAFAAWCYDTGNLKSVTQTLNKKMDALK